MSRGLVRGLVTLLALVSVALPGCQSNGPSAEERWAYPCAMLMDVLQDVRGRHEHHAVWCLTPIDLHDSQATDTQWALFRVFDADDPLDGPPWFPPVEGPAPIDDEARVFRAWCPIDSGDGVVLRGTFAELVDRDELRVSRTVLFVEAVNRQFADIEERLAAQGSWEKYESRMPEIIALGPSEGIWMPYWVRD